MNMYIFNTSIYLNFSKAKKLVLNDEVFQMLNMKDKLKLENSLFPYERNVKE